MLAAYTTSRAANLRENRSTHQSLVKPAQDADGIHLSERCATRLTNHRDWLVHKQGSCKDNGALKERERERQEPRKGQREKFRKIRRVVQILHVELFDLGKTEATVRCQAWYKHVLGVKIFCQCGYCLRPDEDILNKVNGRCKTLIVPYYVHRMRTVTEKKHGEQHQQAHH